VTVGLGLSEADGLGEVFVWQRRVNDLVAVVLEVRRLHSADQRVPAVEDARLFSRRFVPG
jgi:hypothetical protein